MRYGRPPRQFGAYPLRRRLRFLASRLYGTRLQKSQRLTFVDFHGCRYKRIILRDSHLAAGIEQALEAFGRSPHLPPLAVRHEHELWVEYVPGRPFDPASPGDLDALADCFAAIHGRAPRLVALEDTAFPYRVWSDLRFLHRVGVLTAAQHRALSSAVTARAPAQVWVGYDCNDPVSKNFIIRADDGSACVVDVESLDPASLIGWGVAKARARWLGERTPAFLAALSERGAPDVGCYFPYVELCFLARWTKMGFLERKWKYVEPSRLLSLAHDCP